MSIASLFRKRYTSIDVAYLGFCCIFGLASISLCGIGRAILRSVASIFCALDAFKVSRCPAALAFNSQTIAQVVIEDFPFANQFLAALFKNPVQSKSLR